MEAKKLHLVSSEISNNAIIDSSILQKLTYLKKKQRISKLIYMIFPVKARLEFEPWSTWFKQPIKVCISKTFFGHKSQRKKSIYIVVGNSFFSNTLHIKAPNDSLSYSQNLKQNYHPSMGSTSTWENSIHCINNPTATKSILY